MADGTVFVCDTNVGNTATTIKQYKYKKAMARWKDSDGSSLLNTQKIDKCMICLSKISLKNVAISKCGHFYCADCMVKTIDKTNKCGYCREHLNKNDYILCDLINKDFEDYYKKFVINK